MNHPSYLKKLESFVVLLLGQGCLGEGRGALSERLGKR